MIRGCLGMADAGMGQRPPRFASQRPRV